jgi:hypothetical protein
MDQSLIEFRGRLIAQAMYTELEKIARTPAGVRAAWEYAAGTPAAAREALGWEVYRPFSQTRAAYKAIKAQAKAQEKARLEELKRLRSEELSRLRYGTEAEPGVLRDLTPEEQATALGRLRAIRAAQPSAWERMFGTSTRPTLSEVERAMTSGASPQEQRASASRLRMLGLGAGALGAGGLGYMGYQKLTQPAMPEYGTPPY